MSPKQFVSSYDVALRAGVSRSAVSRTFTPGASVGQETRRKVLDAARELGYRVNMLARDLHSTHSNIIGIVASSLSYPYMADLLDHLSAGLLANGMQTLILNARSGADGLPEIIGRMLEYRVRAVVMLSGSPPEALVSECAANSVRMILVNRRLDSTGTEMIHSDDEAGADLAFEKLRAEGRSRLAVVGAGTGTSSVTRRLGHFAERARAFGMPCTIWTGGLSLYETGCQAARAIGDVDGVFASTDIIALGILNTMRHELGRRVPEDVSVIGFDDIPEAAWSSHQLTTVRQDRKLLADAIIARIVTDPSPELASLLVLPVSLVKRETTL